jgi:hypothetical protein
MAHLNDEIISIEMSGTKTTNPVSQGSCCKPLERWQLAPTLSYPEIDVTG